MKEKFKTYAKAILIPVIIGGVFIKINYIILVNQLDIKDKAKFELYKKQNQKYVKIQKQ